MEKLYEKHKYPANCIYNVDKTGLSVVQSKIPRVIASKEKRQIGALTAAERGSLVTIITCMSAGGNFVPPLVIFPRKNMDTHQDGCKQTFLQNGLNIFWIQQNVLKSHQSY